MKVDWPSARQVLNGERYIGQTKAGRLVFGTKIVTNEGVPLIFWDEGTKYEPGVEWASLAQLTQKKAA